MKIPPRERLRRVVERFGRVEVTLETLADLDRAIDDLCARLEREGRSRDPAAIDLWPYFGVVWPSARALAEAVVARAKELNGTRVLEIGCGLGAPGIVAARLGAQVTANDFRSEVPAFLARNQALNGVRLAYLPFDWRRGPLPVAPHDWVLASDVLYDEAHSAPVARALAAACAPGGRILLADPGRSYLQPCLDALAREGFRDGMEVIRVPATDAVASRGAAIGDVEVFVVDLSRSPAHLPPSGAARTSATTPKWSDG